MPEGLAFDPAGGSSRTHHAATVVISGGVEADLDLYDVVRARLPDIPVIAASDCTGLRLIQGATEDEARAACTV